MTWTYNATMLANTDPSVSNLHRLRLELADTDTTEQLLQDEEIDYLFTVESDLTLAAARGAEMISRIFARQADKIENPTVKLSFTERIKHYSELATTLRKRASGSRAPIMISQSRVAKQSAQQNTDRTGPYFRRGMQDRFPSDDTPNPFSTGTDQLFTSP